MRSTVDVSALDVVRDWYRGTSICGISHARDAGCNIERAAWIAVFAAAVAFTAVQVSAVFAQYFQYKVEVNVVVKHESTLKFPTVSLCSSNRVHCGNLASAIAWREEEKNASNPTVEEVCDRSSLWYELELLKHIDRMACHINVSFAEALADYGEIDRCDWAMDYHDLYEYDEDTQDFLVAGHEEFVNETGDIYGDNFLSVYAILDQSTRIEIGIQFEDFIRACTFKNFNCLRKKVWSISNSPLNGNCFTFNDQYNENDPARNRRHVAFTGSHYGLNVVLDIDRANTMFHGLTDAIGARVAVYPREVNLMPDESGFNVYPNTRTGVAITHKAAQRLPDPYETHCTEKWEDTIFRGYEVATKSVYTLEQCRKLCLLWHLYDSCRCYDARLIHDSDVFAEFNLTRDEFRVCRTSPTADDTVFSHMHDCVVGVFDMFDAGYNCRDCRVPCNEESYDKELSTMLWPSIRYRKRAAAQYLGADSDGRFVDGLLMINIYFKTLNTETLETLPKITRSELISDLGGALSLMLGISIVMLLEFAGLFANIVALWCKKKE